MTDDEAAAGRQERVPLVERLLPPVDQHGEDGSLKPSRMTPREQLVAAGLGFANVGVSAAIASVVTQHQVLVLLAGLLASVLILVGARVGNRLLALAGLFTSTLISGQIFFALALPYYAGAFWILPKYNRMTKAQAALRRRQRAEQRGRVGGTSRPGRTQPRPGKAASAKAAPPKSKRYTPPKAQKKRPAPPPKPPKDRSIVD
ncbi:MAG: hypothetical protein AVDCRST_MAG76-2217 [uncultured Acidimicrobiales bacterium]|uniref:Uncharacterized protein n=1 Tax=uncultured Acidimicrobiales bacterium TaxID=310071 RepID=A0A6J4IER6_9ACTN|nr:MAG: hypothetical protein AVDCRST_MAG76-2217 [uncultured Acidimicrobiales bacterium]